ncbi:MAG: NYN domain-containing protein [Nitrospinae bacterium]|nr:NYN domain-containing protein [Nitrospinota bacterium]
MKVCVFIDGENFRHNLSGVFGNDFAKTDYLPQRAKWAEFFDWLVLSAFGEQAERFRAYWYVIESVSYFPYKIPHPNNYMDELKHTLKLDKETWESITKLSEKKQENRIRQAHQTLTARKHEFQSRFDGWKIIQDGIALKNKKVEFRRAGSIFYNLFLKKLGQEKAVDVMLATDLLTLRDIYDGAVLVSGDQDYVPAVRKIKDFGNSAVNVAFETRDMRLLPSGARFLNIYCDSSITVPYKKLKSFMNI